MNKWIDKCAGWFYRKFTTFLDRGGGYVIFILGCIAIAFAMIGFYMQMGFDWKWFIFLHLPLYIFCGWVLYSAYKLYSGYIKRK